jgi:hypothetical protein
MQILNEADNDVLWLPRDFHIIFVTARGTIFCWPLRTLDYYSTRNHNATDSIYMPLKNVVKFTFRICITGIGRRT